MSKHAWAGALTLALAACGSTPAARHYTLMAPVTGQETAVAASEYAIEVLPVDVPQQVDVPQFVLRQGAGEVAIVETRQWAAPLGRELRGALADRLMSRLGVRDVYRLAGDERRPLYRIRVVVGRFESALGQYALLDAGWSVSPRNADVAAVNCSTRTQEAAGATYETLVVAHQRALSRLADEIAATVSQLQRDGAAACPGPLPPQRAS